MNRKHIVYLRRQKTGVLLRQLSQRDDPKRRVNRTAHAALLRVRRELQELRHRHQARAVEQRELALLHERLQHGERARRKMVDIIQHAQPAAHRRLDERRVLPRGRAVAPRDPALEQLAVGQVLVHREALHLVPEQRREAQRRGGLGGASRHQQAHVAPARVVLQHRLQQPLRGCRPHEPGRQLPDGARARGHHDGARRARLRAIPRRGVGAMAFQS